MNQPKVILYYIFTPLADPAAIKIWQKNLCQSLNLKGRIIISPHGINGTLGGDIDDLKKYIGQTRSYKGFAKMKFKWSDGDGNDFPKLSVKVSKELVAFGNPDEIKVDKNGVIGGGKHLRPEQVDELVAKHGDDVVFFDGRNSFEAEIGRFKNAVVPNTATTRDFVSEIESGKYDHLKHRPVVTYCTGGIRCEVLSAVMKTRGFKEVYQIDGGIASYGKEFGDDSLWEGALHTFDNRMSLMFSKKSKLIGECKKCNSPANR
ncbi:MAG: rhodanese-related sulfurtransferase, partial [Candidatus Nanopelagicus sp.]|nr:rhodanese-related sulfurtransferase [Candidatus Nanopelagicus sp.]